MKINMKARRNPGGGSICPRSKSGHFPAPRSQQRGIESRLGNLRTLAVWALFLTILIPAAAQPRETRFSISPQRVTDALIAAGVPVASHQVRFLSPVSANVADSAVQVMSVAKWTGDALKVELRCQDHRACLPFYVLLNAGTADTPGPTIGSTATASPKTLEVPVKQVLMRDGDPATLVFENTTLRITLPVICLQSGNRGQKIRVSSKDRKHFFKAEIVDLGLLKATL